MRYEETGTTRAGRRGRGARRRRWIGGAVALVVVAAVAGGAASYFEVFSDTGDTVRLDDNAGGDGPPGSSADGLTQLPTGPEPELKIAATIPEDGSKVMVTTLAGKKSHFTGKVWLWLPPQYKDPKYAHSGFPVMIALPGGPGFPTNYWMDRNLKLEASISKWSQDGSSLPFILAMPVLNPQPDGKEGLYWDGSDIPGQPKMGTWLTEDVPDLVRSAFRTIKSRDGWAFMGNSTGGFAGLKAVLQKPDRFKAVIAGGPDILPDSRLWQGHAKEKLDNSPPELARRLIDREGPEVYLAFQVGTKGSDVQNRPPIEKFVQQYGKGPVKTRFHVDEGGGHDAYSYVPGMHDGELIQWISAHMRGPVPSP
ncbi:alpha/beta hydrolase-fold protein [Streptomyces sp. NPDC101733]|uniref:alpha/beta hydrolase-fold protein n=1 Tax=unclassified Streptomyces TaxID=2593676 RepID=UPI0037FEB493